jgi:hypothetical protein
MEAHTVAFPQRSEVWLRHRLPDSRLEGCLYEYPLPDVLLQLGEALRRRARQMERREARRLLRAALVLEAQARDARVAVDTSRIFR